VPCGDNGGVHAIEAAGHTVGDSVFMVNSGKESLCYVGDLSHPVILLEKLLTEPAKTRVRILNILAENNTRLLAYHFAWPGIGHVARQGDGLRYYFEGMTLIRDLNSHF
jgi:glyoxylase-like metal-dependent hydrolase (beta-lactamase superfamily II)